MTTVFTCGCYDLIHIGHIQLFKFARGLGDKLIVAINSDASIERLKGNGRPVFKLVERIEILRAIKYIDEIIVMDDDNPCKLIMELKPNVHVKGGDRIKEEMTETPVVESYGGKVIMFPTVKFISSTNIIRIIHEEFSPQR